VNPIRAARARVVGAGVRTPVRPPGRPDSGGGPAGRPARFGGWSGPIFGVAGHRAGHLGWPAVRPACPARRPRARHLVRPRRQRRRLSDADNVPPSGLGPFQRRSGAAQPPPMTTDACVRLGPIDHLFAAKRWASADKQMARGAAPSRAARPPRLAHGGAVQRRPEQTVCPQRNGLRQAATGEGRHEGDLRRSRTPSGDARRGAAGLFAHSC